MTRNTWRAGAILTQVALLIGCAHAARRPYPTIEEYSDGTSLVVAGFARALQARDRAGLEKLCSDDYTLVPAVEPSSPAFDSPSGLRIERFIPRPRDGASTAADGSASVSGSSSLPTGAPFTLLRDDALKYLLDRRETFVGIVRNDARIGGVRGRGGQRTVLVHTTVHGLGDAALRMQEESWWRWELRRQDDPSQGWVVTKAIEERRTLVGAPQPIFAQVYPEGEDTDWRPGSKRPEETQNVASPGSHDTGGVAILHDCIQGGSCILVGGGDGIAALSQGDPAEEEPYTNQAKLLGLDGSFGEAKSLLAADFNNDGIQDLFVTSHDAPSRLFQGGRALDVEPVRIEHLTFRDITPSSGLEGMIGPYRTAIALDADRDGRLDLYVVQYGDATSVGPSSKGRNGLPNRFFRNMTELGGPIRFVDESHSSGADDPGWGLAAAAADFDGDGRDDIFVANDFGSNVLYRNVTPPGGPVRFRDVTVGTGTNHRNFGMGVAWGDYDLDGDLDLYVSNYWFDERWILEDPRFPLPPHPLRTIFGPSAKKRLLREISGNSLYRNETARTGRFARVSEPAQVFDGGWSWGTAWSDVDGDGHPDLVVANGMLAGQGGPGREVDFWNEISSGWMDFTKGRFTIDFGKDGITGPQAKRLFLNLGDGTFADVAFAAGFDTTTDLRGLAATDVNNDGAPDLVGGGFLDSPVIFVNLNAGLPPRVLVKLEGTVSNWDAVGAVVRVTASGRTQTRQVSAGGSFLSDAGRWLEFGIGPSSEVDEIVVDWPSGSRTSLERPEPRQGVIVITEPPRTPSSP